MLNYTCSNEGVIQRKELIMDELIKKIKKVEQVIQALTRLALEIGTLLAVIKMVVETI